jgi:cysteine desulfuration protein SufE
MKAFEELKQEFLKVKGFEDRYKLILDIGKTLENYPEEFRQDKFKVKGCQSQVWLKPEFADGKVHFYADSDSLLVKGIVAIVVRAYNDLPPDEILNLKADFLKDLGLAEHLSMNRSNGLMSMIKQVQLYALVFKNVKGNL